MSREDKRIAEQLLQERHDDLRQELERACDKESAKVREQLVDEGGAKKLKEKKQVVLDRIASIKAKIAEEVAREERKLAEIDQQIRMIEEKNRVEIDKAVYQIRERRDVMARKLREDLQKGRRAIWYEGLPQDLKGVVNTIPSIEEVQSGAVNLLTVGAK